MSCRRIGFGQCHKLPHLFAPEESVEVECQVHDKNRERKSKILSYRVCDREAKRIFKAVFCSVHPFSLPIFFSGGCTFLNTAADLILFACAEIQLDASFRNIHYRKVAVRALEFNKISAREVESVTVGVGGEFFERRLVGDGL